MKMFLLPTALNANWRSSSKFFPLERPGYQYLMLSSPDCIYSPDKLSSDLSCGSKSSSKDHCGLSLLQISWWRGQNCRMCSGVWRWDSWNTWSSSVFCWMPSAFHWMTLMTAGRGCAWDESSSTILRFPWSHFKMSVRGMVHLMAPRIARFADVPRLCCDSHIS